MVPGRTKYDRRKLFLTIVLLFLSVFVRAAGPDIEVSVGFDNLFVQGSDCSVSVLLRSPDTPLDAQLIIEYHAGTALKRISRYRLEKPVRLPAGLSGVYHFMVPVKASTYPLSVRLEKNGILINRLEVELRPLVARGPLIVGLSRRPSLDALIPGLAEIAGRQPELRYPRIEYLPEDPRGWEGADLVLWHDLPPGDFDSRTATAFDLWLSGGGTLVLFEGPWLAGGDYPEELSFLQNRPESDIPVFLQDYGRGRVLYAGSPGSGRFNIIEVLPFLAELGFPDNRGLSRGETDETLKRISRAARLSADSEIRPLISLIVFPALFSLIATGLLISGFRIRETRIRWTQIGFLTLLAAIVFSTILLLPASGHPDPVVEELEIFVTGESGPALETTNLRLWSPRGTGMDLTLRDGQLPRLPENSDVSISVSDREILLEAISPGIWQDLSLNLQSVSPLDGNAEWVDLVLIADGKIALLDEHWKRGHPVPSVSGPYSEPSPGPHSAQYEDLVKALAAQTGQYPPLLLARRSGGRTLRLLAIPGFEE